MRLFLAIIIILISPSQSFSEGLKICSEGIKDCENLIDDAKKYSVCMRQMCFEYYSEIDKKKEDSEFYFKPVNMGKGNKIIKTVEVCNYGVKKCNSLKYSEDFYWECIADSCKDGGKKIKSDCDLGKNLCVDMNLLFSQCINLTCGSANNDFETCPKAKLQCGGSLNNYWNCVYEICLGPVEDYKKPSTNKKTVVIEDENGVVKKMRVNEKEKKVSSAPQWFEKPPKGIDIEEWIRDTVPKFKIYGNLSENMRCRVPTAILKCGLNDIRSCRCSDGTFPIIKGGMPSPDVMVPF